MKNVIFHAVTVVIDHKEVNDDQWKEMVNRGVDEAIAMAKKQFNGKEFHVGIKYNHDFPRENNTEVTIYCHQEQPNQTLYEEIYFIEENQCI